MLESSPPDLYVKTVGGRAPSRKLEIGEVMRVGSHGGINGFIGRGREILDVTTSVSCHVIPSAMS